MADVFQSFFMGGFECATHRRRDGQQIDVLAATQHDTRAAEDFALLAQTGIRTVRDGLRWHLIETAPGVFNWSSFLPMLDAALSTNTQVIWDLCHWGVPAGLDLFSDSFPFRFAAFSSAAAQLVFDRSGGFNGPPAMYCPINEISFWSWVGGDVEAFAPHNTGRGEELKKQLVKASIKAMMAVLAVDPRVRFVQAEPIINIVPKREERQNHTLVEQVQQYTEAQYEAWDMICGDRDAELGGFPELLDIIGVNYYWNNQWEHEGGRTPPGHPDHRPLHEMLEEVWLRYRRPIVITETGAEAAAAVGWLGYIAAEVRQAQRAGVEMLGLCIYPVMDYPGWDDERHCSCGLLEVESDWGRRSLRADLSEEISVQTLMRKYASIEQFETQLHY